MKKIYDLMNNSAAMPNLAFHSDMFKCPSCGYAEYRRVLGNVSHAPCTRCGNRRMIRV
jgi:hypothetical protein